MTSHLGLKIATITNREKILEKYIYFHRPIFTHMNMLICHRHSKRMRSCVRKESWVRNPVVVEALHSLHCTILSIYMYSLTYNGDSHRERVWGHCARAAGPNGPPLGMSTWPVVHSVPRVQEVACAIRFWPPGTPHSFSRCM